MVVRPPAGTKTCYRPCSRIPEGHSTITTHEHGRLLRWVLAYCENDEQVDDGGPNVPARENAAAVGRPAAARQPSADFAAHATGASPGRLLPAFSAPGTMLASAVGRAAQLRDAVGTHAQSPPSTATPSGRHVRPARGPESVVGASSPRWAQPVAAPSLPEPFVRRVPAKSGPVRLFDVQQGL